MDNMMIRSTNTNNNSTSNSSRFINMERPDQETNTTVSSCNSENGSESPSTTVFHDFAINKNSNNNSLTSSSSTAISSPKKSGSRRSAMKRVVTIPIKEIEGSRLKGDSCHTSTPPSDSWAWRKYGQKPIKGSPYPRGYYRCSSSKGCPARKQVERSRVDPTMLLVTYSAEHNHPWPVTSSSRNNHSHNQNQSPVATSSKPENVKEEDHGQVLEETKERFVVGGVVDDGGLIGWFGDHMETVVLDHSPVFAVEDRSSSDSLAVVFPIGGSEEDESLFADLGELPECSLVFRHRGVGPQVEIF